MEPNGKPSRFGGRVFYLRMAISNNGSQIAPNRLAGTLRQPVFAQRPARQPGYEA